MLYEVITAWAAHDAGRPPSSHYQPLRDYLGGGRGWEDWAGLGLQGLADLAVRLAEEGNAARLAAALPQLPAAPFAALCAALENVPVGRAVAVALLARATANLERAAPDLDAAVAAVRGMARVEEGGLRRSLLLRTLASPVGDAAEVLAAIGGRAWEGLLEEEVRHAFLDVITSYSIHYTKLYEGRFLPL